jgi:4-amino-4-deoxy-L-arabinose transferase-like glycosyltransferase
LSGGDRFVNAVQWLAVIGSVLCTSLITKLLGGDSRAQIFAAVLAVTVPMVILRGSSTQNDLVVTLWLLVFVSCVLRMMASSSRSEPDLLELRWQMMGRL